jgi:uncharacterized damage-inducible protein DinB
MEIKSIGPFLEYWESVRGRTRKVVQAIPPSQMRWTYMPGRFSLGDIVRHLATIERYMYAETVQGKPSSYPGYSMALQKEGESPLGLMDRLHAESVEIFKRLTDEDLTKKCVTPAGTSITIWKWLRAMVEHEAHHRGQLYMMLSMLGVATPPLYGLTEEEVRAKSVRQ